MCWKQHKQQRARTLILVHMLVNGLPPHQCIYLITPYQDHAPRQVWDVTASNGAASRSIDLPGHRSDVRAAVLSQDASLLVTASNDAIKLWNPHTGACLRTAASGYGLCGLFAPGGRHVVLGTKEGAMEVFEVASGTMTARIADAHGGAVWSMAALPDGGGFVSGGADRKVVVWEWAVEEGGGVTAHRARELELTDDVLCVRVSGDGTCLDSGQWCSGAVCGGAVVQW